MRNFFFFFFFPIPASSNPGFEELLSCTKNCFQSSLCFGPRAEVYPRSSRLGLSFFEVFFSFAGVSFVVFSFEEPELRFLPLLSLLPLFSPAISTIILLPFKTTLLRAFITMSACCSATSKNEKFCIRSMRPICMRSFFVLRLISSMT